MARGRKKPEQRKRPPRKGEGRPKTMLTDLPENWKQIMIDLYREGGTDIEVRCALPTPHTEVMSDDLWERLIEEEHEFSRVVHMGRRLAETWHQSAARKGMFMGKDFNAGVFGLVMKNRFGWSDKQQVDMTVKGDLADKLSAAEKRVEQASKS